MKKQKGGMLGNKIALAKKYNTILISGLVLAALMVCGATFTTDAVALGADLAFDFESTISVIGGAVVSMAAFLPVAFEEDPNKTEAENSFAKIQNEVSNMIGKGGDATESMLKGVTDKMEALGKTITALKDGDKTVEITKEIARIAGLVKAIGEKGNPTKSMSFGSQLRDGLESQKEALLEMIGKSGHSVTVKVVGTMGTGSVTPTTPGGISELLNDFESGTVPIPRSAPFIQQLFAAGGTSGSTISYAEMKNPEGGAGMTAEGALKSQADFEYVEAKSDVKKVTAFIKTSKEGLADIAGLQADINGELTTLVELLADSQVLSGDGTGNNLSGILNVAPVFTGGALALTVEAANNYDVLVAAIQEIMVAEVVAGQPAGFMANVIVLHPVDVASMNLTKDLNDNYIFPVHLPGAQTVLEVPVISNARMVLGDFLVMDTSKGNLRIRESFNINIGYENDDFTKNLVTILGEKRLAFFIKSNHVKAFLQGDFTAAKALLETI